MTSIKYCVTEIKVTYKRKAKDEFAIVTATDAAIHMLQGFDADTLEMQEQFVVLYLNAANQILGLYKASAGGITGTVADIRIILSIGLKLLATSFIIAHNHPSGNLKPSRQDQLLTNKMKEAASLVDIKLLDHLIIVPNEQFFSFADEGLI